MITVIKRDGSKEPFDAAKPNSMCEWATKNAPEVNWSEVAMDMIHNIPTEGEVFVGDIQKALIKACLDKETYAHNKVAGRLLLGEMRKECIAPDNFMDFYEWMVEDGYWREMDYTNNELLLIADVVNQDIDEGYGYPTLRQFQDKYCLRDENGYMLELPQFIYAGVAMSMFEGCPVEDVITYIKKTREHKISLPSPILSGQRTSSNMGVSCVITTAGDSVQGIEATKHIASVSTAHSAGMGAEYSVRSIGDDVRKGYAQAGGQLPHLRVMDKLVKELKQSSRGGSCTVSFTCLDPELVTLLNLKLKRTPETKRIDLLDYSFVHNNDFLRRAAKKQKWALVSREESPELYEYFYTDPEKFSETMDKVLADDTVKKVTVNALEILIQFLENRQETGRIYRYNVDEGNAHTPFKEAIRQSNLCMEVMLPTKPYNHITELYKTKFTEGDGVTAQCFLSAIDVSRVVSDEDYEETAYVVLKSLDNLLENMTYPFPQFKVTAQGYRSVGVGMTNLAHLIASSDTTYADKEFIHKVAERHYYFLLKASVRLAKERGKFGYIEKTRWSDEKPWLPIDTYNKNVDNIVKPEYKYDWEALRKEVKKYGVRFSVITNHMPVESSSLAAGGAANGLYPIRQKVVYKDSKKGRVQFFAPDVDKYDYELAWDVDPYVLLDMYAIVTKFDDQSISADTYVDLSKYPNKKIPTSEMVKQYLYGNKLGVKTLYYQNTRTGRGVGSSLEKEPDCESCSL